MARNYEKRFTGLNRFLEAKQKAGKVKIKNKNKKNANEPRDLLYALEGTGEKKRRPPLVLKRLTLKSFATDSLY